MSSEALQVSKNMKKRKMSVEHEFAEKKVEQLSEDLQLCQEQLVLVKAKLEIVQARLVLVCQTQGKERHATVETL